MTLAAPLLSKVAKDVVLTPSPSIKPGRRDRLWGLFNCVYS